MAQRWNFTIKIRILNDASEFASKILFVFEVTPKR